MALLKKTPAFPEAPAPPTASAPQMGSAEGHWLRRGARRLFFCSKALATALRPRRLALVAAGAPGNARAAAKASERHRCVACGRARPASCFSRKMLTRPPQKRRCSECVGEKGLSQKVEDVDSFYTRFILLLKGRFIGWVPDL